MEKLENLFLTGNNLKNLPEELYKLKNLKNLNLIYNDSLNFDQLYTVLQKFEKPIIYSTEYGTSLNNSDSVIKINVPYIYYAYLPQEEFNNKTWSYENVKYCVENTFEKRFEMAKKIRIAIMHQEEFEKVDDYGNMSWYCVFAYDFEGAIWAGEKYIENGGTEIGYISNLGLGYLWNGDFEKAKNLYLEYKDTIEQDGRIAKDIFLSDIAVVEAAEIVPVNQEYVDKMRELLNND